MAILGMHIMEGYLPVNWVMVWLLACLPFLIFGIKELNRVRDENPRGLLLIAFVAAFAFVLSALKMPSVTGSCSHPTGMGLGTVMFGPAVMSVIGMVVLLFQALLLAHGGLTTLGANTFSMGVAGPLTSWAIYALSKRIGLGRRWALFLAAAGGDLLTYVITSLQLALAHPAAAGGVYYAFLEFAGIFAFTQVPIAVAEGILTVMVMNVLLAYNRDELLATNI